jgi:hypothetical protein
LVRTRPLAAHESGDRPQDFPGDEIDDTEAVVAEFGNEEPFAFQINREMVDPTADGAEWNPRL